MSLLSPQLEAFLMVVQQKTVHGAATLLHITQTAVTQRIRSLEAKLGTTLFVRTRRGMMVTPEGEALLRYCYAAQEIEDHAMVMIKNAAVETPITIVISGPTSIMSARIIPRCIPVMQQFPNLLVQFDINDVEDRVESLRAGRSQFVILREEDVAPEMEYKKLESERYVLVCSSKWSHRKLHDIVSTERIIDYDPLDAMTFNYLKEYDLFDHAQHERYFANRTEALATLLVNGLGYGVLTTEFSNPYIESHQLIVLNSGKIFKNNLVLAWYERHEPPGYFTALIKSID